MKPVKLTIEGINSFTTPQTLDFESVGRSNLFCISGKTGAGKTTVFDSIMLALYGKSTKGNLADVVNLSLMSARVVFEFFEKGARYTVDRTIKCRREKSENGVKTDRRTAVSDCILSKDGTPIAKGEDANDIIAGIVGLEASEFKNVYLLEQGEYAAFLKKTPSKQTEAVGKIFSLMRFGDVHKLAGDREREELSQKASTESTITALGDISPSKLHDEKASLQSLRAKTTTLVKEAEARKKEIAELEKARDAFLATREKQNTVNTLTAQAEGAKEKAEQAIAAAAEYESTLDLSIADRLVALREELNKLNKLNALDREYVTAVSDAKTKTAEAEKKRAEVDTANARYAELNDKCMKDVAVLRNKLDVFVSETNGLSGKSVAVIAAIGKLTGENVSASDIAEALFSVSSEKTKYDELCKKRKQVAEKLTAAESACKNKLEIIEKYASGIKTTESEISIAELKEKSTSAAYVEAQLCSHAASVRAELHAGDKCPVCGGVYNGRGGSDGGDVEKRKAEYDTAVAELKKLTDRLAECTRHCDIAKSDYDGKRTIFCELNKELADIDAAIASLDVQPDIYTRMIVALNEAKIAEHTARQSNDSIVKQGPAISALKAQSDGAEKAVAECIAKAEKYKIELGELCGKTSAEIERVKTEISNLETETQKTEARRKTLASAAEGAKAALVAIETSLAAAKAACPVDIPQFDEDVYTEKRDAIDRLIAGIAENERDIAVKDAEITMLAEKCKTLDELKNKATSHSKRADIYSTIVQMTRNKAMLNYVAAEYIADFTSTASEILGELSSGKYSMGYDNENGFVVSDYLNGGKARKTDTLSGGELFLASLSVAIAIARTQSRGNNAFFFLDEGFGTLDEDLIDVVYGALESLSKDCLVGVITHAESLISRMPFCVHIEEATDTCGSRIAEI